MNQLPSNREAERAVLGSVLINNSALARVVATVRPQDFHHEGNGKIFGAILALNSAPGDGSFDTLTVKNFLDSAGELDRVGGSAYISGLLDFIPDVANVERYAAIVAEKAKGRRIISACTVAQGQAMDGKDSVEVASTLQLAIAEMGVAEDRGTRGIFSIMQETRNAAEIRASRGEMLGVETGYGSLDAVMQGIPRQALTVIAAPSSHGKTAFALNIGFNAVQVRPSAIVATYSLEMSEEAISNRLRARVSRVPLHKVKERRFLSPADLAKVEAAEEFFRQYEQRLFVTSRISSISDLTADARRRKVTSGLDLAIVDYLQLLEGIDDKNRERTVNQIAWSLHEMARELNCAVIALSQVTPAAEQRASKRLSIDDLRDSKAIGHHARVVIMLQRPWQSDKSSSVLPCKTIVQVEKNSEGETGDLDFHFSGSFQEFTEGTCNVTRCQYASRASRDQVGAFS